MEHDVVELGRIEEAMAAHGDVSRGDALERASGEVGRKDDVDDMAPDEGAPRGDRVDHRNRALEREVVADRYFLCELAAQCVDEALAAVDSSSGQEPVLAASGLLVAAQQDAPLPAEDGRDTDARLERHQWAELPKPFSPRSLGGSSGTSFGSVKTTGTTTSWAIRIPGSTTNGSCGSVLRRTTLSSPR